MSRAWRVLCLTVVALSLALSFCHLMELAARLRWGPELWMAATVFGGLYALFGSVGAVIDLGAIAGGVALAFALRRNAGGRWAVAGAALLALAHGLWWALIFPMNAILATWKPGPIPGNFAAVRDEWEISHAAIALMKLTAFVSLQVAVLGSEARERGA